MRVKTDLRPSIRFLILAALAAGCSTAKKSDSEPATLDRQVSDLQAAVVKLNEKLQFQEDKVATLTDQLNAAQTTIAQLRATHPSQTSAALAKANAENNAREAGEKVSLEGDPKADLVFEDSDAITQYRNAQVLFDSSKYAEAILGFSQFLKEYADHPLAGSAQFFIGESYFQQGEYGLALKEYQRGLVSYDRSAHVSDGIARIADCQEKLGQKTDSIRTKETLVSLFPQSPQAARLREGFGAEPPSEPSRPAQTARGAVPETAPMEGELGLPSPERKE